MAKDIQAYEASLIGCVLISPEKMAHAVELGVKASWFTVDSWSLMWSALEGFWKRGEIEGATPVNVRAEAQRIAAADKESRVADGLTVEAIQNAIDDATPGPIDSTVQLLRNCDLERRAKKVVGERMLRLETWHDYADGLSEVRAGIDEILGNAIAAKKIPPRVVFEPIMAGYDEAHRMRVAEDGPRNLKWTPGIKMPWPKMTAMMNGLRPGLHVVAARPSVGKTAYTINLMRFWCETGTRVLFCSLDMPRMEVMRRFIAEKSRVSVRKALFSPTKKDLADMSAAVQAMSEWPLDVVEMRDVDDLRTLCMIEQAAGRLGVVVVDYLQLMHARALGREDAVEYARVSYVSDTLKRIANELHVPVVALAQLNRESTKQDAQGRLPGLADLRGSGSIEQDAFTVTILHRDALVVDKWAKDPAYADIVRRLIPGTLQNPGYKYGMDDLDAVWWIMCKSQNGPTGKLPFVVRKKYFCWMLGDYKAEPISETTGYGSTQKTVVNYAPRFAKVHADWRHDPIENDLRLQLALLPEEDDDAE